MLSLVVTEAAAIGADGKGMLDKDGNEAGPLDAREVAGGAEVAAGVPVGAEAIEFVTVGWASMRPMPMFANSVALEMAMGNVALCCTCSFCCDVKGPPLLPAPCPRLVGGLKIPSDGDPVARRADPGAFEEKCEVGGEEDEEPNEEAEDWENAPRLGAWFLLCVTFAKVIFEVDVGM